MTFTFTQLIIIGLAVWRISNLFVYEGGPGYIFQKIRERVGITHDDTGNHVIVPETFMAEALSCVWCCSLWVGIGFGIFWFIFPELLFQISIAFSLSAVAVLIHEWRTS